MSTPRVLVSDLRQRSHDLLSAPFIPPVPRLNEVPGVLMAGLKLLALKNEVTPRPKWSTRSDNGLLNYPGALLAVRQLLLLASKKLGERLPPGFADMPYEMLAIMGQNLPKILRDIPAPTKFPTHGPAEAEVMDAWETSGMGLWARPGFFLSHIPHPNGSWTPLTFDLER